MFELVEFDIPELLNVNLKFEEEVSPVGVLKRGGLKRVANGEERVANNSTLNLKKKIHHSATPPPKKKSQSLKNQHSSPRKKKTPKSSQSGKIS